MADARGPRTGATLQELAFDGAKEFIFITKGPPMIADSDGIIQAFLPVQSSP